TTADHDDPIMQLFPNKHTARRVIAHQSNYLGAPVQQCFDQPPAHKPGGPSHKNRSRFPKFVGQGFTTTFWESRTFVEARPGKSVLKGEKSIHGAGPSPHSFSSSC